MQHIATASFFFLLLYECYPPTSHPTYLVDVHISDVILHPTHTLTINPTLTLTLTIARNPPRYESARAATFSAMAAKAMVVINDKKYYDPAPPYPDAQVRVAGLVSARGGFETTGGLCFANGLVPSP